MNWLRALVSERADRIRDPDQRRSYLARYAEVAASPNGER